MGELYASTAIADLALAVVLLFEPIFLFAVLKFSIQEVLWFFAAVYGAYTLLLIVSPKVVARIGYKRAILLSMPFQIAYWVLLFGSQEYRILVYFAPLAFALEKSLFWPGFHSLISTFARKDQRGREFSALYAIVHVVQIVGPLVGGILSEQLGVRMTFVLASFIYCLSAIPLFWKKELFVAQQYRFRDTVSLYKQYPKKFLGYVGFGEELLVLTIWPIFIYLAVADYQEAGAVVTIATLVSSAIALYIGKISDIYSKQLLIKVGAIFSFLVWIFRFTAKSFWGAFGIDTLSRTSKDVVFVPLSALTYERAADTKVLPYVIFFEQSLAIGKFLAAILGVLVFTISGGSFIALFFLAALFSLLYMYL
jgi:MFS family permease